MRAAADGYTSGDIRVTPMLSATAGRAISRDSGDISTRKDGRVVDGGGLENLIGHSFDFAILRLNSARHARYASVIGSRPVVP